MIIHVTSPANVEYSLNAWFIDQLATIELPAYMVTYSIGIQSPETPLVPPAFSFNHIAVMSEDRFQGNVAMEGESGTCEYAIMEINAWVSRDQLYNGAEIWRPRLQYMAAMIKSIRTAYPSVVIQDIQSNPDFPMATPYKINLGDIKSMDTRPDVTNPAFERRRMLMNYWWVMRV